MTLVLKLSAGFTSILKKIKQCVKRIVDMCRLIAKSGNSRWLFLQVHQHETIAPEALYFSAYKML